MRATKNLGVYVHVPFCERKCWYCDFFSRVGTAEEIEEFVRSLEVSGPEGYVVRTIYFGGGTPSLLSAEQVGRILGKIRVAFEIAEDAEVTIECNPNSVTKKKLKGYRRIGVNRVSIGAQSFDDGVLRELGRLHNARQAVAAVEAARGAGFENISIDLIHSVQAGANLRVPHEVLAAVSHVSAYCLTPERLPEDESVRQQKIMEKQ